MSELRYELIPVGHIESSLTERRKAPKQGREGAPEAWVIVDGRFSEALLGLAVDQEVILITWLHLGVRTVMQTRPRDNPAAPLLGVFGTRSPDRPNPIGLHRVRIREVDGLRLRVAPLEAIDGTPVVDIKPVLSGPADS
jgi:tRNA-Thr(GGU) m(6)t(6)A37 methyltransferase TsaA